MDDLLKEMGKRIHDRRKQLHMTQERLAELAGITPQTVSTAELGQKAMRPDTIIKISTALEVSTDYLLLGKVTGDDQLLLSPKVSELTPIQYRHLETLIESFVAAVKEKETQENFQLLRNADNVFIIKARAGFSSVFLSDGAACFS